MEKQKERENLKSEKSTNNHSNKNNMDKNKMIKKLLLLEGIEEHLVTALVAKKYGSLKEPYVYKLENLELTQKVREELNIKRAEIPVDFVKNYNKLFPERNRCGSSTILKDRFIEFFENVASIDAEENPQVFDDILVVTEQHVADCLSQGNDKYIGNADTFIYNKSQKVVKSRLLDKLNAYLES